MKKVILPEFETEDTIPFQFINVENTPIFIKNKHSGKIVGMFAKFYQGVSSYSNERWMASIGGGGLVGYHKTLIECMRAVSAENYEFLVDI